MNKEMLLKYVMDLSKTMDGTNYLVSHGYMKFTGNQWNESWGWVIGGKNRLRALELPELLELYKGAINKKPSTGRFMGTDEIVQDVMDKLWSDMLKEVKKWQD